MPDLTIENYWQCDSVVYWETEVPSSRKPNEKYTVVFEELPFYLKQRFGVSHDFTCNCKGFQLRQTHK